MSHDVGQALPATPSIVPEQLNPTKLQRPSFLLCAPFALSTRNANNVWMEELTAEQREPNQKRAMLQFLELYRTMAAEGLVYLLPTPRNSNLQDQVYTANLGVVLEHVPGQNTVVISNFSSEPRVGEALVGERFFESLGYDVYLPEHKFEGEAELKHLHDNVYVGGYGMRTENETFDWMERSFGMEIVRLELSDPYLYHLDCSVFPITSEDTLVCTEMFEKEEIEALAKHTNVIDVSYDDAQSGICNSVRLANTILNGSNLHELKAGTEDYDYEIQKNRRLEDIAVKLAFEVSYFNLSEYLKSGALLSCMVMHLNRNSYRFALTS